MPLFHEVRAALRGITSPPTRNGAMAQHFLTTTLQEIFQSGNLSAQADIPDLYNRIAQLIAQRFRLTIIFCEECGAATVRTTLHEVYHGNSEVCTACFERHYHFDEDRDTYIHHNDNGDDMPRDLLIYNANPLEHLDAGFLATDKEKSTSQKPRELMYMGVELEVERRHNAPGDVHNTVNDALANFAITKGDGSLDNGFEICTVPATLAYHLGGADGNSNPWEQFFENCSKHLRAWSTDTCGIHVHLSRMALLPLQVAKMQVFLNNPENEEVVDGIAGRGHTNFAQRDRSFRRVSNIFSRSRSQDTRYTTVNMEKEDTIELRLFRGNVRKEGLFRVLEFCQALADFCAVTSITRLKQEHFLEWLAAPTIAGQFPYFVSWCITKDLLKEEGHLAVRKAYTDAQKVGIPTAEEIKAPAPDPADAPGHHGLGGLEGTYDSPSVSGVMVNRQWVTANLARSL